jgi:hypothetical protein
MSRQYWQEVLTWAVADGAAIANTATETVIYPNITIPANYLQDGRVLRIIMKGKLSTTGTPTITFRARWGGVAGTILAQSAAITNGSSVSNVIWELELILQVRSNGSSGSVLAMGRVNVGGASSIVNFMGSAGATNPAAVTVDLTADTALAITAQWGTASTSNTLTGMQYIIESLN